MDYKELKAFAVNLVENVYHFYLNNIYELEYEYKMTSPLYSEHFHETILNFLEENWLNGLQYLDYIYKSHGSEYMQNLKYNLLDRSRKKTNDSEYFIIFTEIVILCIFLRRKGIIENEYPEDIIVTICITNWDFNVLLYPEFDKLRMRVKGFLSEVYNFFGGTMEDFLEEPDKKLGWENVSFSDFTNNFLGENVISVMKSYELKYDKEMSSTLFMEIITGYYEHFHSELKLKYQSKYELLDTLFVLTSLLAYYCSTTHNKKEFNTIAIDIMQRALKYIS